MVGTASEAQINCFLHFVSCLHSHPTVDPVGRDFMNYWSAPALALQDQISAIFDPMKYHLAQETLIGRKFEFHVWSYPPTLLLLNDVAARKASLRLWYCRSNGNSLAAGGDAPDPLWLLSSS